MREKMEKRTKVNKIVFLLSLILSVAVGMIISCQRDNIDSRNPAIRELEILLKRNPLKAGEIFKSKIANNPRYQISEVELDSLGYHLIKQNKPKEALIVFKINVELFPDSWKAWDSLGEGFMYINDETQCREAYNKSLENNGRI